LARSFAQTSFKTFLEGYPPGSLWSAPSTGE
jgi:hypothetical protein